MNIDILTGFLFMFIVAVFATASVLFILWAVVGMWNVVTVNRNLERWVQEEEEEEEDEGKQV